MKLKTHSYTLLLSEVSSQVNNLTDHLSAGHSNSVVRPYIFDGDPPVYPREAITIRLFIFHPRYANLLVRKKRGTYVPLLPLPIPTVTNSVGFAVAVLQNNNIVRGIYNQFHRRVKVDTLTSVASQMSSMEIQQYPVDCFFHNPGSIVSLVPEDHHYPWK